MDVGLLTQLFPELILERSRQPWSGELLEYFDIETNKWEPLANGGEAILTAEENWPEGTIEGLIKSVQVRDLDCAVVAVQEAGRLLIGLVRGKDIRISGEEEIEFSEFVDINEMKAPQDAGNIWSDDDDMFDVSGDLHDLLAE